MMEINKMILIKTKTEIQGLREAGKIVAHTFEIIREEIRPGITLKHLDEIAEKFILKEGAETLYKGITQRPNQIPYPGVITAALNNEICHGMPDARILKDGDIVGIDIGLKYKGWCGDSCVTFKVGKVKPQVNKLVDTAAQCLMKGIRVSQIGNRIGVIGANIQNFAESRGFSVVREYGGHGIGQSLWEEPFIPHIGPSDRGPRLQEGMVINIEPMINIGRPETRLLKDEWTVVTADGSFSAQFEHMVAITENGPEILSII
jgi:methionyl aminopeptidase